MSDAIQTSIYKLRPSIAVMDSTNKLTTVNIDFTYLDNEFTKSGYQPQKLKSLNIANYDFRLYYGTWDTTVRWKDFVTEITQPGEDILRTNVSVNEGFILLVSIKEGKKIELYAITGGFGHMELQNYINYQFGLDILSRLIQAEDKVIRSAKERNFIGGVLGSVKYFRGNYNLNENESFGNYYHELRAKLDKSILKKTFKFTDAELKRGGMCDAKTSFTIRKPVTFKRAIELIDILRKLIKKPPIVDLNLIKKLDKSDKALIEKLDKELDKEIFTIYKHKATDVNVELCHRFFDRYYDAEDYELIFPISKKMISEKIRECASLNDVLEQYSKSGITLNTQDEVITLLEKTNIASCDENNTQSTFGKLTDHICAELKFNSRSYFIFNKEWYMVKPDFATILNDQCQSFINAHLAASSFLKKWNTSSESENDFNAKHLSDINTLVFDKVTPENIEACDILKWTPKEIFFIHVKEGFNNEMRNLGRQVHIAARRILQDLTAGKQYLEQLYDELTKLSPTSTYFKNAQSALNKFTKSQFLKLFDGRKPIFVVAILDSSRKKNRSFTDITKFESNIAKFCLHQLSQEMRLLDAELRLVQIDF